MVKEDVEALWEKRPRLNSIPFQATFLCTKEFDDWWQSYFVAYVGAPEAKLSELTQALIHLQAKSTKCKALHIKQIQAFQKYFRVVYRPNNLRRTISEAAAELKEKATPEKPSDDDERPISQVLKKSSSSDQPRSTDLPVPSPQSKKSKKHKRSAATGPEPTPQPTQPSPQQSHKPKGHQGHKRKKRDSPSKGGEAKKKKQHKMLTTEAHSSLDADTIVVDTSILNMVSDPAVGTSTSTNIPAATILEEGNPDIVLPTPTQADASGEQPHHVVDYTPLSMTSSPSHQATSVDNAGEFTDSPIQTSDSDSVTSPATHTDSSSTSSDSSLSSASLTLQDSRGQGNAGITEIQSPQTAPLPTNSPSSSQALAIKPSALEAIARLHSLVRSRDASSDSEQFHQLHYEKMGPEATKVKALIDKVRFYALNSDLSHVLLSEPAVGPELLHVLAQLRELHLSEYAKCVMATFEKLLVPMLRHIDNVRENEHHIETTEAFVKEKWELVMKADEEVTKLLGMIEEKKKELAPKQTRFAEIRLQIDDLQRQIAALDSELGSITEEESRIVDKVVKPAQDTVEQTTTNALVIAEELSKVEKKLEQLRVQADNFEPQSLHYNLELQSF
ncbi:histone promoter control protein 2-like [Lathyrus oleraceus]|uniref:histone promoter control protein 2-like n=1 Tax=Pisum sativum TaxID=3888 RepID=UPI0021CE6897|nr:histone promoter control protein 2-like [Pisum sativum]